MKAALVFFLGGESAQRLGELRSLCRTADYDIEREFTQKGRKSRRYLVRKGKVREIREFIESGDVDVVVFENFLSSGQVLALEDELNVPVIDRFDLILNVFELHARSKEAKLQIELARLKRRMPYLKMYLSRKVRTEHPGFGGSGEFIVHSTLTTIHRRIKFIEKNLKGFERRLVLQRSRRRKVGKVISLAGYTNVGKTTLLRALTGVESRARDELFTTLRTKTGRFRYKGQVYLLNDTIGFIRDLPLQLIYAFNATLMEISSSDLILIVHDSGLDQRELLRRKQICEETLEGIGATDSIWLDVENKTDIGTPRLPASIGVSAETGDGIENLKKEIHRLLRDDKQAA